MAKQRYVNTKFWTDPFIQNLDNNTKMFYIYLLTNQHTNIAGIYEISIKTMEFESGIKENTILKAMDTLSKAKKAYFIDGFIVLLNFQKHQNKSPKILKGIEIEIGLLPQKIKDKLKGIDTLSIDYGVLSHSNTNTNTNTNTKVVIDFFNKACNKSLTSSDDRNRVINKRIEEGKTVEQLCDAITNFSKDDWKDRQKFCDIVYAIGTRNGVDNFEKWFNTDQPKQEFTEYDRLVKKAMAERLAEKEENNG